jgi:serine/threonine-protein kinase
LKKPPAASPGLSPGDMVGEYRIVRGLGEGGFGTVYEAVQPIIDKRVAIKVLKRELTAREEAVSRFIGEARAVNQIRHRNIVDIFSFGTLPDHQHYFVMELLEGTTLREHMKQHRRLLPAEVIALAQPIGRALDAAHRAGIAHRDLKPDNIFLARESDGRVVPKLIDFGIAKLLDGNHDSMMNDSGSGSFLGTPRYMSPEQCRGMPVDHRSDVYSLGVVLYEMLTGSRLFEGSNTLDIMTHHTMSSPLPPSEVCPDLPAALDDPILDMLAKKREHRPATVGEAIQGLAKATNLDLPSSVKLYVGSTSSEQIPTRAREEEAAVSDRSGSATVTEPSLETPRRSRRIFAATAFIALASMAVFTLVRSRTPATNVAPVAVLPAAQTEAPATGSAFAPPPVQESPLPSPSAAVPEPAKSAPPRVEKRTTKPPSHVVRQAAVDCSFPYILDASGIRKIRPECLK